MRAHSSRDKVEYGTARSFRGQSRVIWSSVRERRTRHIYISLFLSLFLSISHPLSPSRKHRFRIYRDIRRPRDALLRAPMRAKGTKGDLPSCWAPQRERWYHCRRYATRGKNTKCKTCPAICLPLCGGRAEIQISAWSPRDILNAEQRAVPRALNSPS